MATVNFHFQVGQKITLNMKVVHNVTCGICDGTGKVQVKKKKFTCPKCFGDGVTPKTPTKPSLVEAEIFSVYYRQQIIKTGNGFKPGDQFIKYNLLFPPEVLKKFTIDKLDYLESELDKMVVK